MEFDTALIQRYDRPGPRYTSYPTARQFGPMVGESEYRRAIAHSNEDIIPSPLSLYLHLPFCPNPCFYCGCSRLITRTPERIAAYLERLHREIAMQGALIDRDRTVRQLHFGGGTPTYLSDPQLDSLLTALHNAFTLSRMPEREYSIEADPRSMTPSRLQLLATLGFNRISFGIQDFDPAVQEAVNRIQDQSHCLDLIKSAYSAGFRSVSVDLIYGLPKQNLAGFTATLRTIAEVRPHRVAVYGYAHLPEQFKAQRQIHSNELPDAALRLRLLETAIATLTAAGYVYIGLDHFALPDDELVKAQADGTLQRNFQGYSTYSGLDMVSIGMTAISHIGDTYAQNAKTLSEYYAALDSGHLATQRGLVMSKDDQVRADIIAHLMCHDSLRYAELERRHGIRFREYFAPELIALRHLQADGLIELGAFGLTVLPRGRFLRRTLAMVFDAYLPMAGGITRYSKAL